MKRILVLAFIGLFAGCNKEGDVSPATGTFIRYFGSENNNDAVLAIPTPEGGHDGFVLLSNIEIQLSATEVVNKIKLTRTTLNGDLIPSDSSIYPKIGNNNVSMKASSLIPISTGYLIVGEWIKKGTTSRLLLVKTDFEGLLQDSVTISGKNLIPPPSPEPSNFYWNASLSGRAVIASEDNSSYVVLAKISNSADDMYVAQIDATNLTVSWERKYRGNSRNEVVSRLFADNGRLFWSATVGGPNEKKDIRIIEAPMNSESPVTADPVVVSPASDEVAWDFCKVIGGWAIVGSTNVKGDGDICLVRTATNGAFISQLDNVVYSNGNESDADPDPQLNDEGKSVTVSADGNIVVLGTVETPGNQKELFLAKLRVATNVRMWKRMYGGGDNDEGASVRALSDGSLLVFGTTHFGRSRKLMLMKLNPQGEL